MVKNESKILYRCLDNIKDFVHSFCIVDTGSTDNTVALANEYVATKTGKVYSFKWHDFGHNRTLSFHAAVNFAKSLNLDLNHTYGLLLDADMIFKRNERINFQDVLNRFPNYGGFRIKQTTNNIDYYNIRFIKLSEKWTCRGVTHEVWMADDSSIMNLEKDICFIDDVGDGGCKNDKFERDLKLLLQGIEKEPENKRYMFYLGQTYNDLKNMEKSIEWYKKRIDAEGWNEEVWFSYYSVSRCYMCIDDEVQAEEYAMKAYDFYPSRAENLYLIAKFLRSKEKYEKAYKYITMAKTIPFPMKDLLFVERNVYNYLIAFEESLIYKFYKPENKTEQMQLFMTALNKAPEGSQEYVYSVYNCQTCCQPMKKSHLSRLLIMSNSILQVKRGLVTNYSFSNAIITDTNERTFNADDQEECVKNYEDQKYIENLDSKTIYGLFHWQEKLHYIACFKNHIEIATYPEGLNVQTKQLDSYKFCVPYIINAQNLGFIRSWNPFVLEAEKTKVITGLPNYFKLLHSMSVGIDRGNGECWYVCYQSMIIDKKAVILHNIVSVKNAEPFAYTYPFYFESLGVEHCTNIEILDKTVEFIWVSCSQKIKTCSEPIENIEKMFIPLLNSPHPS